MRLGSTVYLFTDKFLAFLNHEPGPLPPRQAWWCIVDSEEGFGASDRMRAPGVTTGFHPNED